MIGGTERATRSQRPQMVTHYRKSRRMKLAGSSSRRISKLPRT